MMFSVKEYIEDRIDRAARVAADLKPATGVSKFGFDWIDHALSQAGKFQPHATVVFLGANDGHPMKTPTGQEVECCGEPWIAEYARRVSEMMSAYFRDGAGRVVWMTLPAPRDEDARGIFASVNAAVRRAASEAPRVRVVAIDEIFTPDFTYRKSIQRGGRRIRVRAQDGIHLSVPGAQIAAGVVEQVLRSELALGLKPGEFRFEG